MSFRFSRWLVPVGAVAVLLAGAVQASAGVVDPEPIGPNQFFTPLVNGQSVAARIVVTCDDQTGLVPAGHPVAGQTVAVQRAFEVRHPGDGFTGTAGTAVTVGLNSSSATNLRIVLRSYPHRRADPDEHPRTVRRHQPRPVHT
jgi:hypothetical protein